MHDSWEHVKEWVKKHPYLAAALGIGVLILFYLWWTSGTSSSSSTTNNTGALAAARLQAETQLGVAQTQMQAANTAANDQASTAKKQAYYSALSTIEPAIAQEKAMNEQTKANETLASKSLATSGYDSYLAMLSTYSAKGAEYLNANLPPPPGTNPVNYQSTGGEMTTQQAMTVARNERILRAASGAPQTPVPPTPVVSVPSNPPISDVTNTAAQDNSFILPSWIQQVS